MFSNRIRKVLFAAACLIVVPLLGYHLVNGFELSEDWGFGLVMVSMLLTGIALLISMAAVNAKAENF